MLEIKNSKTGEVLQVADKDLENTMDWISAKNGCTDLGSGWRLPTLEELNIMYEDLHLKRKGNFQKDGYWRISEEGELSAWGFNFKRGGYYSCFKSNGWTYVRAVRVIE
jgi:hypothetical protein